MIPTEKPAKSKVISPKKAGASKRRVATKPATIDQSAGVIATTSKAITESDGEPLIDEEAELVIRNTPKKHKTKSARTPGYTSRSKVEVDVKPEATTRDHELLTPNDLDGLVARAVAIETTKKSLRRSKAEIVKVEKEEARTVEGSPQKAEQNARSQGDEFQKAEKDLSSPKTKSRKRKAKEEGKEKADTGEDIPKIKRKRKTKEEDIGNEDESQQGEEVDTGKTKRKLKTKEEKEAEAMPLAERTNCLRMFIGAHVSSAKGVHNAVTNCLHIGGNAFALFLKSQRKWENPPLQDEHRLRFKDFCAEHKYDATSHVVPHGSYLVNLAQEDAEKAKQAFTSFLEDLHRCEALGIKLYNFHPGNTGSSSRPSAIARIAGSLNRAHAATKTVKPLLENMAGAGNVIGSTFEDLRDIIAQVDDKSRIGVCLDTCHSFAAGYDLRTPEAFKSTLEKFDKVVGMKYLSALHLNDSKAPFASHRDLHQNIGVGFLGLRAFHNVMNEPRFEGLPMVLETPIDAKDDEGKDIEDKGIWAREIKMLEGLIGMDTKGEEFGTLERELAGKGKEEREKFQEAFERKTEKERKAALKGNRKKSGKREDEGDDEGGERGAMERFLVGRKAGEKSGGKKKGKRTVKEEDSERGEDG